MSMKGKLNRFKKHLIQAESKSVPEKPNKESQVDIPFLDQWLTFGAKPFYFDGSYCFVREITYPLDQKHGLYRFSDLFSIVFEWNKQKLSHPISSAGLDASELFFFDTETTGLGGGVGNTIFLLGHARISKDKVVVKQHFLPNPGSEVALYQSFLADVNYTTLVTYNGKAFDWPQVKTRHTLIRDAVPKLPSFGHFDLYHSSRRLWKNQLDSVRLGNVEREILDVHRDGDIPGYLAPMLYFDFIKCQNPEGIFGVLRHNEIDVLSLITLYIHLSKKFLESATITNSMEQFEVARWFEAMGETAAAIDTYQIVAEKNEDAAFQAKLALANAFKRDKRWDEAVVLWKEIHHLGSAALKVTAGVELAKVYEHRIKDYEQALYYAQSTFSMWKETSRLARKRNEDVKQEFEKRIMRLKGKLSKL